MSRSYARFPWAQIAGTIGLGGIAVALSPGCTGEEPLPGTAGYLADASWGSGFAPPPGSCAPGSTMKCGVTLGVANGLASCFEGVNECVDGHWSECRNGTEAERPMPPAPGSGARILSLSQATLCGNNPCDPRCQQWIETPDGGLGVQYEGSFPTVPDGGQTFPWSQGSYGNYPTGSGRTQPCTMSSDCQMSTHCVSPSAGTCAHSQCATGAALSSACNACVTAICALHPTCCSGSWTQQCVDDVATVCGATCTPGVNPGDPPRTEGTCEPWYPDQTDPTCAGVDLAIGPTCATGIPVCNHGQAFAPAGVTVTVYPGSQFKQAAPAGPTSTCTVPYWIAPGWCRVVPGCTAAAGDALVVKMPGTADGGSQAECRTDDNWSLHNAGACSDPICSSNASAPETTTVNLFFMVDQTSGAAARWAAISNGLKTFLSDPDSAGVHVAFRLFPDAGTTGCTGASSACNATACSTPAVEGDLDFPIGTGSPCTASPDPTECSIFAALSGLTPSGANTPTSAALAGAVAWAKQGKAARPNEEFAVVFMTDGEPDSCDTNVTNIAAIAADGLTTGVRTYVVGVEGLSAATCQSIATAGGGAGQCFRVLSASGNTTAQTVAALRSIATGSVSCTVELANQGMLDPSGAAVNYTAGTTPTVTPACRPDQSEYGGHCYYRRSVGSSWSDAENFCRSFGNGWHLASIGSSGENAFITTLVGANRAWISGEDGAIEGTWTWADGSSFPGVTSASPYANWTSGQPSGVTAENCIYFNGVNVPAGTWNDIDCPGATYPDTQAVCEGPKEGDTSVTACPTGQVIGPDNLCYLVDTTPRTWAQALANCQALGMDLVNVTSKQQDLFLAKEVSTDAWINLANYSGTWTRGDATQIYTTSSTTCGPGETLNSGRCYSVSAAGTWTESKTACEASGGSFGLTKIESSAENAFVQGMTAGADSWISANDSGTEGTWRWSDNSQFFSGRSCLSDEIAVNGVCYHVETATPATWANAKAACSSASRGGKLVEIGSSAKNADVAGLLGSVTEAWIGASDSGTEGKWVWDSTQTQFWTGTGGAGCPSGTKTYNGHCYTTNGGGAQRWSVARNTCHNLGLSGLQWELTTISSDAENAWILSNFTPTFWIGAGRDLCPSCTPAQRWSLPYAFWADGTAWGYTHWDTSPAQPDTYNGCVSPPSTLEVSAQMQTDGYWNDDCDDPNNSFPYLCEAQGPSPIGLYNNWATTPTAQPDAAASGDDCAVIATNGTWSDTDCSATTKPYVCEVTQGTVVGGAYTNWTPNQPSGDASGTEDCGVMSSSAGAWSDLDCTTPTRPGVCEGPLHSGPIGNNYNQWATSEPSGAGERARIVGSGAQKGRWAGTTASATYASVCVGSPAATTYPGVLSPVANAAACTNNGQFYYDNATDPATLTLCPKACTAVQSDGHGRVNVEVECKKTTEAPHPPYYPKPLTTSFTESYVPTCGQNQTPVWQFLAYDTTTPSYSTIDFDVRVGNDATSLAAAPWITAATASAASSNQVCGLPDPCLVDLFTVLGQSGNSALMLELRITLRPTVNGDTPEVHDWRITHTCKDNL